MTTDLHHSPPAEARATQRMRGELDLRFAATGGRTRLAAAAQQPPLQVVRGFALADGGALVHLHNIAGGVLGGDRLSTTIAVGQDAAAQLTTTGATRVYRSRDGAAAVQSTAASVAGGGLLEYLPDPTIPFAGAVYEQSTRIDLADGAGLCWWEILAPGREAHGERFAYRRLALRLDIWAEGRPIALERMALEPARRPLASALRFGGYAYLATGYICRVGLDAGRWADLEARLADLAGAASVPGEAVWGVSRLPAHGLALRGLAVAGRSLAARLPEFWSLAKQELYGRKPNIPRKIY